MKLLLDTHAFLWFIADDPALSRKAKRHIEGDSNELLLSIASIWEMAIKASLGKLTLSKPLKTFLPEQLASNDVSVLEIAFRHACAVETLAFHHRDPFDRLMAAQCLEEDLPIVSGDPLFEKYGVKRIW